VSAHIVTVFFDDLVGRHPSFPSPTAVTKFQGKHPQRGALSTRGGKILQISTRCNLTNST